MNEDPRQSQAGESEDSPALLNVLAKRGACACVLETPVSWKFTQGIRCDIEAMFLHPVL